MAPDDLSENFREYSITRMTWYSRPIFFQFPALIYNTHHEKKTNDESNNRVRSCTVTNNGYSKYYKTRKDSKNRFKIDVSFMWVKSSLLSTIRRYTGTGYYFLCRRIELNCCEELKKKKMCRAANNCVCSEKSSELSSL